MSGSGEPADGTLGLGIGAAWAVSSIDVDLPFFIEERGAPPAGEAPTAAILRVSHDLFDVLGMRLVEGRGFSELDRADAPPVIVVNENLARRHFGERSPLGERLVIGPGPVAREIVGVVGDLRPRGHESDARPEVYFPLPQYGTASLTFVLHTEVDPATLVAAAHEALWAVDPGQSIWGTATLDELLGAWTKERRFNLALLGAFAGVALLLATVGVYGLVSFRVEGRVAELGIRRVLGSDGGGIVALIVKEGLRLGLVGIGIGLAGALVFSRFMRGMLWETPPADPLTLAGVAALMLAVSTLASLVPRCVRCGPIRLRCSGKSSRSTSPGSASGSLLVESVLPPDQLVQRRTTRPCPCDAELDVRSSGAPPRSSAPAPGPPRAPSDPRQRLRFQRYTLRIASAHRLCRIDLEKSGV